MAVRVQTDFQAQRKQHHRDESPIVQEFQQQARVFQLALEAPKRPATDEIARPRAQLADAVRLGPVLRRVLWHLQVAVLDFQQHAGVSQRAPPIAQPAAMERLLPGDEIPIDVERVVQAHRQHRRHGAEGHRADALFMRIGRAIHPPLPSHHQQPIEPPVRLTADGSRPPGHGPAGHHHGRDGCDQACCGQHRCGQPEDGNQAARRQHQRDQERSAAEPRPGRENPRVILERGRLNRPAPLERILDHGFIRVLGNRARRAVSGRRQRGREHQAAVHLQLAPQPRGRMHAGP